MKNVDYRVRLTYKWTDYASCYIAIVTENKLFLTRDFV